jgi:uncharacterized protein YecT (DUF1311 family)
MVRRRSTGLSRLAALLVVAGLCGEAAAIDHPDAPDRVAAFSDEADRLETAMLDAAATADFVMAGSRYQAFLDEQLSAAFDSLKRRLAPAEAEALAESQRLWERFREQEKRFIDGNWTPASFGSSSLLSRHHYLAQLTRTRTEQLLHYLRNYPNN